MAGPLQGVRIVEFEGLGPGPFAAMLLADLGADLVRIARPGGRAADVIEDAGGGILFRGRPVVTLDLKVPADRDAALALIAGADALIEGFRPGVMERMGLGPDACHGANPRLVYGRMTGWGQDGPLAQRVGHDITYLALTGALAAMGEPGRPPVPPLNLAADFGGGSMFLVMGLLAALLEARASGTGQVVDAAMVDGGTVLMSMMYAFLGSGMWSETRGVNLLDGGRPYYACYECADGRYVAVGALEPKFFATLVAGLGLEGLAFDQADPAGWPAMREAFAETFRTRTREEWATLFEGQDACVAPVLAMSEVAGHPHMAARGALKRRDPYWEPQAAPRFSRTPAATGGAPEALTVAEALARWERAGAR